MSNVGTMFDMGSQAEASSSASVTWVLILLPWKPFGCKALTRKYKIPMDLPPCCCGLPRMNHGPSDLMMPLKQTKGTGPSSEKSPGKDCRAIPDAMCWRHHDSDISDPAPKNGFDEADVIALTHQSIDIRGISSGLLFSVGLAITWEFP
ncbi:hypothetical protein Tco_1019846 [Tanacetum coccineum]|uniref:Uncharacterized protein n=1 Tax=Tanacetum coccineum TaxID=301880 RepID=A0ABQ5FYJ4_9ASTR